MTTTAKSPQSSRPDATRDAASSAVGVSFSGVSAQVVGAAIDVTFDVRWSGSWGPGNRGAGFCDQNWDAAWVFFKYRFAETEAAASTSTLRLPIESVEQEVALLRWLDAGDGRELRDEINRMRLAAGGITDLAGDPWGAVDFVVRTEEPGQRWSLDIRDSPRTPSYRVLLQRKTAEETGVFELSTVRRWAHAQVSAVRDAPRGTVVELPEDGTGVFIRSGDPKFKGTADHRRLTLRLVMKDFPADLDPRRAIELWPLGLEMVHVTAGPFWLGDPEPHADDAPRNCFYDSCTHAERMDNRAYLVFREDQDIHVGPEGAQPPRSCDQLLWYSNDDDARGAGDQHRLRARDALTPGEKWSESKIPAEFPKGVAAFYLMKRQVSQGEYAAFINALDGGTHWDRYGQLVRFSWDGAGTHRGTVEIAEAFQRASSRPARANNHLCWADGIAFAAWAGLRPMSELEYEKACRGPKDPVAREFAWGEGPGRDNIAREILGHEDGTEMVVGNCNIGNVDPLKGGDGGRGPVRDDAFDKHAPKPASPTVWLNVPTSKPRARKRNERVDKGLSYYGIAALTGNLWELTVTVGTREGRAYRGAHGRGEISGDGEAPYEQLGWPGESARSVSWRGGSWYTHWRRGHLAARPYGSGAPGFFHRSHDAGFRAARSATPTECEGEAARREAAEQLQEIRAHNPEKLLTWLSLDRARAVVRADDAVCAKLFDLSVAEYRAIKDDIDIHVGQAARELRTESAVAAALAGLSLRERAVVLGLGDDATDDRQSWFHILRHLLDWARPADRLAAINAGVCGETTTQTLARLARLVAEGLGGKPMGLILCFAGASDARRLPGLDRTLVRPEATRENLEALREMAQEGFARPDGAGDPGAASRWVWITPILPLEGVAGPDAPARRADLDAVAKAVCAAASRWPGDALVDLASRGFGGPRPRAALYEADGLRPSREGQKEIARAVLEALSAPGPAVT
jgi:formylglycine-generating enzyme required for sulfatase activity/lysophospholipase L1-like esterase